MKHLTVKSVVIALALLTVNCSTTKGMDATTRPSPSVLGPTQKRNVITLSGGRNAQGPHLQDQRQLQRQCTRDDERRRQSTHILSRPERHKQRVSSLPLADGYLLDRRGISPTTAFTSYTYSRYSALSTAPDASQLIKSIIPGAKVTEIVELPMTTSQAATDTARCNSLIREGLPGCKVLMTPQVYHLQE